MEAQVKIYFTEWDKMFATENKKNLISIIHKVYSKLNNKSLTDIFPQKIYRYPCHLWLEK